MKRFSGRREAALGLGAYAVYLGVRALVANERGRARAARNARRVCALEERLGLHLEPRVQERMLRHPRLLAVLNLSYVSLNVVLTVGWLGLLWRRRHPEFHRLRRAAALSLLGACPVFLLFPCDPPRSLDGFVDTVADVLDLDSGLVVRLYNPVAAMPSIHLAFAVVTGAGMAQTARSPLVRAVGVLYPPAVLATVVGTANHYVLDGIAGSCLALLALRISRALER
ncbi:MAG TPA: phosphatase PAP2 family protein [Gaiellaceae bacterium]|nr:phosphatase PAP2 family protein [Gaiellaceae bacterium]